MQPKDVQQLVESWRNRLPLFDGDKLRPLTAQNAIDLLEKAMGARELAYAKFSNFLVGAAVLDGNGVIHTGCNIENPSYGATVCAERVAAFKAISSGCRELRALAVIGEGKRPLSPCGLCRQVLMEFNRQMPVIMANMTGELDIRSLAELLPFAFDSDYLPPAP
jgi:cytidine deaminase